MSETSIAMAVVPIHKEFLCGNLLGKDAITQLARHQRLGGDYGPARLYQS